MNRSLSQLHLVLCFTRGLSLAQWQESGLLNREIALYQRLLPHLAGITFVTYGGEGERDYLPLLGGISLVYNRWHLRTDRYQRWLCGPPRPWSWRHTIFKSNQLMGAELPLALGKRWGKPCIVRCGYPFARLQEYYHGVNSAASQQARQLENKHFRGASHIVTTTQEMAREIVDTHGTAATRIRVIPNYVDTDQFHPRSPIQPASLPTVLFVGRQDPVKNLPALLEAMAGLPVRLVLVGDGPVRPQLEEQAHHLGLAVTFLGRRNHQELPGIMQQADIFVLPSLSEGHPKALIEAMACGLPVIGCRVPGVDNLIQHGHTGLLCQPTAPSLRAALQSLLENPALRRNLGEQAAIFAAQQFSLSRITAMELSLLEELFLRHSSSQKGD